jgi:TRAP-type C4-dicarboxylate transport system substrate-binding protein
MFRRQALKILGASVLLSGVSLPRVARAAEVIKIGTLAPAASPWGQVFKVWADAVKVKSAGQLELQFFFNGQQGDEGAMVGKIKAGQLDAAAVTGVGLSKIYKPVLALQMPGLFRTWAKLDAARNALKPELEGGIKAAGFTLAGWGDVGAVRMFSKGFPVRKPDDLKGKKPFMWRDDIVDPVLFQIIGGVTPVPLNIPEVLPNLNTGAINVVRSAALATEQLQWATKLDTLFDDVSSLAIGGLVFASRRVEALPADLRAIVLDTGKVAANALQKRIRDEDDAALGRLKNRMTVVTPNADEKAKWDAIYKQVRQRLGQGTFAPELVAKLEALAV